MQTRKNITRFILLMLVAVLLVSPCLAAGGTTSADAPEKNFFENMAETMYANANMPATTGAPLLILGCFIVVALLQLTLDKKIKWPDDYFIPFGLSIITVSYGVWGVFFSGAKTSLLFDFLCKLALVMTGLYLCYFILKLLIKDTKQEK